MLSPEGMSSPRQAGCLGMKLFHGPGEPHASLSELGSRKIQRKTILPPSIVSFCFLDQNTE